MERIWFNQSKRKVAKSPLKEATESEKTFETIFGGRKNDKQKKDKRSSEKI